MNNPVAFPEQHLVVFFTCTDMRRRHGQVFALEALEGVYVCVCVCVCVCVVHCGLSANGKPPSA